MHVRGFGDFLYGFPNFDHAACFFFIILFHRNLLRTLWFTTSNRNRTAAFQLRTPPMETLASPGSAARPTTSPTLPTSETTA